jgi:hypothetical protein
LQDIGGLRSLDGVERLEAGARIGGDIVLKKEG